ncbi:YcxB family protein [Parasphingopyxis sp. CP4]|uniref:YcxB family protein n=1 Tax=Parasphingopyxis sp. CP4 TaxID=2724527 RepID=UPI0015A0732C|nr:YcxB family protein [Parasphingopyxis sp. CP4]QLC21645.1 YcxB family protein [Parasphingopyxis sp. CP4]
MMGEIRFQLTEDDGVDANRLYFRRQMLRHGRIAAWLVGAIVLLLLILIVLGNGPDLVSDPLLRSLVGAVVILIVLIFAIYWFWLPWQARKLFRQTKLLQGEITALWTSTTITYSGEWGSTEIAWSDYHRWMENERLIVLFQSDAVYNIVPKAVIARDEVAAIGRYLEDAGVKKT